MAQLNLTIPEFPMSLIQACETHQDRTFQVRAQTKNKGTGLGAAIDTQEQTARWNLTTHTIQPRHPLGAWMWLNDPLFRVCPEQLRQRMMLDATTEWQERCNTLAFPRVLSKKKALEGFGAVRPDLSQAKAAMIAIERYSHDNPLLWILWNEEAKKVSFLDDKVFPRQGGYKQIWIMREPHWDRLWDASEWSSEELVLWIQKQEETGCKVEWPQEPSTATLKGMAAEYNTMGFSAAGLSKDTLRERLGRAKAIRVLSQQ